MPSASFADYMRTMDRQKEVRERFSQSVEHVRLAMKSLDGRYPLADDVRVEPVDAGGVPAEWVTAGGSRPQRVILYVHGGCYISGAPSTVRECCSRIARACQARVLSIDYRLAPEHPHPAALDDVVTAYGWLLQSACARATSSWPASRPAAG